MENIYLRWYKEIEIAINKRNDISFLMSSSVSTPTELLLADLEQFNQQINERTSYTNAYGHPLFVDAIAKRYDIDSKNVVVTNGVSNGIYLVCRSLLKAGDHVIVETPMYQPLKFVPKFIGAEISLIERCSPDYKLNIEHVIDLTKPSTKLIMLTNLHNPTGALTNNQDLIELAQAAKRINPEIKIFVDEIYRDFVPGELNCAYKLDDCFVSLNSLTKVYGLGIIHQGWLVADEPTVQKVRYLQNLVEGSGSRLLESFASLIVENLESYRNRSLKLLKANIEILSQQLQPLINKEVISSTMPQYGCVCFPEMYNMSSTDNLAQQLIDRYDIYVVPGKFFNTPNHIRIGFGGDTAQLESDLTKLSIALLKLI